MPLKIEIKTGDKIIINGAVMENDGPTAKFLIHNRCAILREKEVMAEEDSNTPASRVYFALQCAYIFPHKKNDYLDLFGNYVRDYLGASPSSGPILDKILEEVTHDRLYQGLRAAQELLDHEDELIARVQGENTEPTPPETPDPE
ncbi:MAG: flagellar biosynthesis repressor FlbT [Alphaproteobacteria bacterium]|nr:flagellar biosynthesis repressor FlbT [Alphaproteobacteria bacterium]MBL6945289.1 flagellar biosynthesis repressor FlbT [Rhodospirillales bacterium]